MTLILTVANSRGVYQSSDYQLIDHRTHMPVSDRAGSKQLAALLEGQLELAFTGIANTGAESTIDHLSAALTTLPDKPDLREICQCGKEVSSVVRIAWTINSGPFLCVGRKSVPGGGDIQCQLAKRNRHPQWVISMFRCARLGNRFTLFQDFERVCLFTNGVC